MRARRFEASSVELSPIACGTMRLNEGGLDEHACFLLVQESLSRGITTFHSSNEYESFPRFCRLVSRLGPPGSQMQHVVKLAEPHFGDVSFDQDRLRAKVDAYLTELGTSRIDVVQWMWRGELKDEEGRLAGFKRQRDSIQAAFNSLRTQGKIGAVVTFPYTLGFADAVLSTQFGDGLAVYLNPLEKEMLPHLRRAFELGAGAVAIRPLAAGKAASAGVDAATCLREVLATPGVKTAVVSYSTVKHLEELARAAASVAEPNETLPSVGWASGVD